MKFLIFELSGQEFGGAAELGGEVGLAAVTVEGRWWGCGGGAILIRMRGFCETGFIMQFLIVEPLGAEAGLAAVMVEGRW